MDAVSLRVLMGAAGSTAKLWGRVSLRTFALRGVTWTGSGYVAVGDDTIVARSTDGAFWTTSIVGDLEDLFGVVFDSGVYVSVGSAGSIFTSTDALQWTKQTSGLSTSITLRSIASNGSIFTAVGSSGTIVTSADGITWVAQTSGVTALLSSVVWSGTQFVAVGTAGTIITSPDGISWTAQTSGASNSFDHIAYDGSTFVAVGETLAGSNAAAIRTSSDAVSWTNQTPPAGAKRVNGVAWNGSRFVGGTQEGGVIYSADGITWALLIPTAAQEKSLLAFASSGSNTVAVGEACVVASSVDITTNESWVSRNNLQAANINSTTFSSKLAVVWDGLTFVSAGFGSGWATSLDGLAWTSQQNSVLLPVNNTVRGLVWTGSQIIAVGDGGSVSTRTGAGNWVRTVTAGTFAPLRGVAWSGSIFAAVGGEPFGSGFIRSSPDAVTWTTRTSNSNRELFGVTYGNSTFVAVGAEGRCVTSTNGTSWTARTTGTLSDLLSITYGNGLFVACGNARAVRTSPDGINWSPRSAGSGLINFRVVFWDGDRFNMCGNNGTLFISSDGINWTEALPSIPGSASSIAAIATGNGRTVGVGTNGVISMAPRPATPPYPTL